MLLLLSFGVSGFESSDVSSHNQTPDYAASAAASQDVAVLYFRITRRPIYYIQNQLTPIILVRPDRPRTPTTRRLTRRQPHLRTP